MVDTYCCEKMPLNIIIMIMLYLALAHPINAACAPVHNKKKGGGCSEIFMCYVEHLWLINGRFYADGAQETIDVGHNIQTTIHSLRDAPQPVVAMESWKGMLSVIYHRQYPKCYAHLLRDNLSHDLYAFRRFHQDTWDLETVRQNMRLLYLDGEATTHPGYRIHSSFPPWEKRASDLPNMYFERAVVGDGGFFPPCEKAGRHYFSPNDWLNYGRFIAHAMLGPQLPKQDPSLVWLVNRNRDEPRQMSGAEKLSIQLNSMGFKVITTRPSEFKEWSDQIRLARQASVIIGPHGSNLANIILSNATGVLEFLSRELLSNWYAQQSQLQGVRWFSFPTSYDLVQGHPAAEGSDVAPLLRRVLSGSVPKCHIHGGGGFQMCH